MTVDSSVETFNIESNKYEFSRPQYPDELFDFLSKIIPDNKLVWDCACGTGQASKSLINIFEKVKASDINKNQIRAAYKHENIEYSIQDATKTAYKKNSFDLVCVAQAIHWFASAEYFEEVERVLKDKGIFACWGYSFFSITPDIDKIVKECIFNPLQPYWSEKNKLLWDNFVDIDFPFKKLSVPDIEMSQSWTVFELIEYIKTWSAFKKYDQDNDADILSDFKTKIIKYWPENEKKKVIMDFTLYCGEKIENKRV